MVADRMTTTEITTELPDVEPEDVAAALRCAAEAVRERQLPVRPDRMRLLLDNDLPPRLLPLLHAAGHSVTHVRDLDLDLATAPDSAVLRRDIADR